MDRYQKGKRIFDISKGEGGWLAVGRLCPCATSFCLFCIMGVCLDAFHFHSSFLPSTLCVYICLAPFPLSLLLPPSLSLSSFHSSHDAHDIEPRHQRTHVDLGWVDKVLSFSFFYLLRLLLWLH